MKPEKLRTKVTELRNNIVSLIFTLIRTCPNWYLQVNDDNGSLIYSSEDDWIVHSVTVKDFGDDGERPIVWVGRFEEVMPVRVEHLDIDLMINVYDAVLKELE